MICQRLRYCFAHEVEHVYPGGIVLKPGCSLRELEGTIDFSASEKSADPGKTCTGTVRARSRKVDEVLLSVNNPRVVLELSDGDGRVIIFGSPEYPATLLVSENPPEITLTFSATTL